MINQIKDKWAETLYLIFLSLLIASVPCRATADDTACRNVKPSHTYYLPDGPSGKRSLLVVYEPDGQNYPIFIYLKTNSKCRNVLSTWGRGIKFQENKKSGYPDVEVYWHHGASKNPPVAHYVWVGNKYVDAERSKSEALNKQALKLFNQGKIHEAISLWEQAVELGIIPGLGYTSNSEALNNIGFAYYKLALKSHSEEDFKLARTYLEQTLEVDPTRWVAYLNLGDLYVALDWPEEAIENYQELLELNPKYKNADKIKERIKGLSHKITTK
jgi:tetratricopeptide (TPR) repeat protein